MKNRISFKIINLENKQIERKIIILSVICLSLLASVQLLMTNPFVRNVLTQEEKVEGVFIRNSQDMIEKGTLVLELVDCNKMDRLWVMVNGQRIARFSGKQIILPVSNGELIEIDGTDTNKPVKVKISSFSKNISLLINNSILDIEKNIAVLARVSVKSDIDNI